MRIREINILRAMAIFLILGPQKDLSYYWSRTSFVGLELAFVLTGFLITESLLSEYDKNQTIAWGRFLIRRSLKIIPPFYLLLIATLIIYRAFGSSPPLKNLLTEIFFYQSYGRFLWQHTWVLAVTIHFYLLTPISVFILYKLSQDRSRFDKNLIVLLVTACISILVLRIVNFQNVKYSQGDFLGFYRAYLFPTHLRLDAIFFGVLIAYFNHYYRDTVMQFVRQYISVILILSAVAFTPALILEPDNPIIVSVGITLGYISAAGIILLTLYCDTGQFSTPLRKLLAWIGSCLAAIGRYSYSIFLWHIPVVTIGIPILYRYYPINEYYKECLLYLFLSLTVGIVFGIAVEEPLWRLRDRFFPPPLPININTIDPQ